MSSASYWNKRWKGFSRDSVSRFARRSYARVRGKHFRTLLDVGCGQGGDALYFAKKGLSVTAFDHSLESLKLLRDVHPEIRCIRQDIQKMTLPANSFDIVYARLSLHYFDDRATRKIFRALHRTLRRGGYFFVMSKSVDDPLFGIGKKMGPDMYRRDHVRHFFSASYMEDMLKKFQIVSIRKTSGAYHGDESRFIEAVATK